MDVFWRSLLFCRKIGLFQITELEKWLICICSLLFATWELLFVSASCQSQTISCAISRCLIVYCPAIMALMCPFMVSVIALGDLAFSRMTECTSSSPCRHISRLVWLWLIGNLCSCVQYYRLVWIRTLLESTQFSYLLFTANCLQVNSIMKMSSISRIRQRTAMTSHLACAAIVSDYYLTFR